MHIGLLLYPGLTQLDLTGPFEIFARIPGCATHIVARDLAPVLTDRGLIISPQITHAACPPLDVLCVPGGPGQIDRMEDEKTLSFIRRQAKGARLVTAVCTGSLLLAAAGLLRGRRAACHWLALDQLAWLGATPDKGRVVVDGRFITAAGVSAGLDLALTVAARLAGDETARMIQMQIQYDPAPPFASGDPDSDPVLAARLRQGAAALIERRQTVSRRVAARLENAVQPVGEKGRLERNRST